MHTAAHIDTEHSPAQAGHQTVDIHLAAKNYTSASGGQGDQEGRAHRWHALAVTSDGREAVGVDRDKTMAMAEAVGELIKGATGQTTYRLYPHDRIHHRIGTRCQCGLCLLLGSAPEYSHVDVVPGSHDALPYWEEVHRRCADKVVEMGIATATTTCHGVRVPCTETRDDEGVVISRTLPASLRREIVIGSDASQSVARNTKRTAAAAAVGSDGRHLVSRVDTRRSGVPPIDYAELVAIHLAIRHWIGRAHTLTVRTDSREALRMIERARSGDDVGSTGRALGTATRIAELISSYEKLGGQINLEWVKGHSGDPLNDGADRLAVHARRAAEWGTYDDPAIAEQCRQIAVETVDSYWHIAVDEERSDRRERVGVPAA